MKKIFIMLLMLFMFTMTANAKSGDELKAFNKFLEKEYIKYFEDISPELSGYKLDVYYYFVDIDGDGIKELVVQESIEYDESRTYFYKYENNKVKKIPLYSFENEQSKVFYNKVFESKEKFAKYVGKKVKLNSLTGYPLYRIKGKKGIILAHYFEGMSMTKDYSYCELKNGKLCQKSTSYLFSYDDWSVSDSYLYKYHKLKNKLVKINIKKYEKLISVKKDFQTGNITVLKNN